MRASARTRRVIVNESFPLQEPPQPDAGTGAGAGAGTDSGTDSDKRPSFREALRRTVCILNSECPAWSVGLQHQCAKSYTRKRPRQAWAAATVVLGANLCICICKYARKFNVCAKFL